MTKRCDLILGVDGGGTKTTAFLAEIGADGNELIRGRGQAGSSNIKAVGQGTALANLQAAINAAWENAQLAPQCATYAVFGLSGAGRPETQAIVNHWCHEHSIAERSQVVHDALPVLMAGTPAGQGVALIAGTGAVAYAVSELLPPAVVGGWGFWFGDEGSAFWLGQAAARAVSHAADGRGPQTRLADLVLARLQVTEPRDMLTALARNCADVRSALAELAPLVTAACEQGDTVAYDIVTGAGRHLAALVIGAANKAALGRGFCLALAGGVISGSDPIRTALVAELAERDVYPAAAELVHEPVLGCLKLAARELAAVRG